MHRRNGFKSLVSAQAYEQGLEAVGAFVGADNEKECVVLGKDSAEAINRVAIVMAFADDHAVLCTAMEYPSTVRLLSTDASETGGRTNLR